MNKKELSRKVAEKMSVPGDLSMQFINAFQEVVGDELERNEHVQLLGFGTFFPWPQTERAGRNPRTGKECMIRFRVSVKFRPGRSLLGKLNSDRK